MENVSAVYRGQGKSPFEVGHLKDIQRCTNSNIDEFKVCGSVHLQSLE
jgi:hypothetical protein